MPPKKIERRKPGPRPYLPDAVRTTVYLSEPLREAVFARALVEQVTASEVIRRALAAYLAPAPGAAP